MEQNNMNGTPNITPEMQQQVVEQMMNNAPQMVQNQMHMPETPTMHEMPRSSKVSTIEELQGAKNGYVVELPEFDPDHPFFCRLGRVSLLKLMAGGQIPNSLISVASQMFMDGTPKTTVKGQDETERVMKEMYKTIEILAEASMLEPTFAQLTAAGIQLTDEHLTAIFQYSQRGVQAIENFRSE